MMLMLSLLFSLSASAEPCPLYRCVAKPKVITRGIHLDPGYGYGNTLQEAGEDAIASCRIRNAPGRALYCQVKRCTQNTGPVFPIFGSCENAWK